MIDQLIFAAAERRFARYAGPSVEVCFDCDMADCRHIRARRQLAEDPNPQLIQQLIETGRAEVEHGG